MTRYVEAFSWSGPMERWLETYIPERPVLHVCSGASDWGDTTVDLYEPADIRADWCSIPVADDSYGAVFADPPWNSGYKADAANFVKEALRIAPGRVPDVAVAVRRRSCPTDPRLGASDAGGPRANHRLAARATRRARGDRSMTQMPAESESFDE